MDITKIDSQIRFCAWENYDGLRRHYLCGHHEYCCALGCCVSSAFSFYQLWYFWLLLLVIILVCSGGGWWFRWRHGGFSNANTPTNAHSRRHRRNRTHGPNGMRVYPHPHSYYTGRGTAADDYTLPPGYDKDPPSYNEVISHLSQFPRADSVRRGEAGDPSGSGIVPSAPPVTGSSGDVQLAALPPPSYEMVLDLKRREMQLQREINEEEQAEQRATSSRSRIRNLLGRVRPKRTSPEPPPPLEAYVSSSSSTSSSTPTGLFTISRESLPSHEFYIEASTSSGHSRSPLTPSPSSSSSSSHSDYSSSFISSASVSSRSLVSPPYRNPPPEYSPTVHTADPQEGSSSSSSSSSSEAPLTLDHAGASRPCTGRSVLSRPATSISARTLPPPPQLARKTSLPGAVLENEEDKGDK